jgi:hypothetical protein|tara:strand:+ start:94358 stop:94831 length:474 start_codon:yes stop_codon:yes gene_type:complete
MKVSLRRRQITKPPPAGIELSEASTDRRDFKLSNAGQASQRVAEIEASLNETDVEITLEQREALIKRHEAEIALQIKELRADQVEIEEAQKALAPDPQSESQDFSDEEPASISKEREAYIEASEEALIIKAQQLEELETHLKQWQEELEASSETASA